MPTVLITGANRGIGLEFARQYAADGWRVVLLNRTPMVGAERDSLGPQAAEVFYDALDVAILNAGLGAGPDLPPRPSDGIIGKRRC